MQVLVLGRTRPRGQPGRTSLTQVLRDRSGQSALVGEGEAADAAADRRGCARRVRWATAACRPVRHPLGDVAQLKPSASSPDVSWEAYWLSVAQPGRPYVLEVDYPSDVPQTLGISILEPNAAGALVPIGLDSGVDVTEELPGGEAAALGPSSPGLLAADQRAAGAGDQPPRPRRRPCTARSACWAAGSTCRGRRPRAAAGRSGCWPPTWTARCCRRTSRPTSCSTPGAAGASTTGGRSTRPARGWSSTCSYAGYNGLMIYGGGRRQRDLSQRRCWSRRRATTRACSSPRPRTRSARTCWRCCCGCSTATSCS